MTGIPRTTMESRILLKESYSEYIGSDFGRYHATAGEVEQYRNRTLFDIRLDNYHKLGVKDMLGISFNDYLANPRWVIAEYDTKCAKWSAAALTVPKPQ